MAALASFGFVRTWYLRLGRYNGDEKKTVPEVLAAARDQLFRSQEGR